VFLGGSRWCVVRWGGRGHFFSLCVSASFTWLRSLIDFLSLSGHPVGRYPILEGYINRKTCKQRTPSLVIS